MPISKRPVRVEEANGPEGIELPGLLKRMPHLCEYLSCDQFADGSARKTSTLLLFVDSGCLKGCLNDRENRVCLWAEGAGLEAVLDALEDDLAHDAGSWRPYSNERGKKK